jgi:hypothetical protein
MTMQSERHPCPICGHDNSVHFQENDSLGYWAFCMLQDCDCFLDSKKEENDPPQGSIF